jgi:hypothetical protein
MGEDERAVRTQIYLTPGQREKLSERAKRQGRTMADVIREAVDDYLARGTVDDILERTFGMSPEFEVPPRSEWDRGSS